MLQLGQKKTSTFPEEGNCVLQEESRSPAHSFLVQSGIHGPLGPGTDRSELIRDFQIFVGTDQVRS